MHTSVRLSLLFIDDIANLPHENMGNRNFQHEEKLEYIIEPTK